MGIPTVSYWLGPYEPRQVPSDVILSSEPLYWENGAFRLRLESRLGESSLGDRDCGNGYLRARWTLPSFDQAGQDDAE